MLMMVPVLLGWITRDDLLSMLVLCHLADLDLLSSLTVLEGRMHLVTLIVYDGLGWASDEAM